MSRPVWIVAGGTGGHIFPALSLATELERQDHFVVTVTDKRGVSLITPHRNCTVLPAASPFAGSMVKRAMAIMMLSVAIAMSIVMLIRRRPSVIVGFGGYPAFAPLIAGKWLGIPLALHEQNAVMGRANRFLASLSGRIMTSWPHTRGLPSHAQSEHTGLPVRSELLALKPYTRSENGTLRLVILGGSLGAKLFGDMVPKAIIQLPDHILSRLHIQHQVRGEQIDAVKTFYHQNDISADITPFFMDMPNILGSADLIICRAGASTIAELSAAGRASILIPFAGAADNHQLANAQSLASAGAAVVITETNLKPDTLADAIQQILSAPKKHTEMARNARSVFTENAAKNMFQALSHIMVPAPRKDVA